MRGFRLWRRVRRLEDELERLIGLANKETRFDRWLKSQIDDVESKVDRLEKSADEARDRPPSRSAREGHAYR